MSTTFPQSAARSVPSRHSTFRPDIEGLRGVAVLLVVLFHAGVPGLGGGFTGVDVFFVLSGYLITDLLVQEHRRTGTISFLNFYARRTRRLLPASVLVLALTVVAGAVLLSPLEQSQYAGSALATAAYVSNLHFMRDATDYFATNSAHDPFLHTWSLAVEEQFYLFWPLLIFLGLRGTRSRSRLVRVMVGVGLISLVACIGFTVRYKPVAFFASPLRAWEFGLGGLATLIPASRLSDLGPRWCRALGWAGLAGILLAGVVLTRDSLFPGPAALLPAIATVLALVAGAGLPGEGIGGVLGSPPLQHLGRLSYSWYLWHWPVLTFLAATTTDVPLWGRLLAAAGSLAAAALAYRLIENPIRFHRALVPRPRLTLALAISLSAVALGFGVGAALIARGVGATPRQRELAAAARPLLLSRYGCMVPLEEARLRQCVFGDTVSPITVVLFGDSHAAQWFPALEPLARERHWRLVTLIKASCAVASVPIFNPGLGRLTDECADWRKEALGRITAMSPRLVIAANSVGYIKRPGRDDGYSRITLEQWQAGTRRTFATLDSAGINTVFLHDTPRQTQDVSVCLSRAEYRRGDEAGCGTRRDLAIETEVFASERAAAAGLGRIRFLDFTDFLCDDTDCPPVKGGIVVYRDRGHMNAPFVTTLVRPLSERLQPLVQAARTGD